MTIKTVVLRTLALQDVEAVTAWYREEDAHQVALEFVEALESVFDRLARQPAMGSPRIGHDIDFQGLRSMALRRFPYLVFYVQSAGCIDVLRVLHGKRDLPVWLPQE